jgi:hypothetical protein
MSGIIKLKLNAFKPVEILYKKFRIGFSGPSNPYVEIVWYTNVPLRLEKGEHKIITYLKNNLSAHSGVAKRFKVLTKGTYRQHRGVYL